MPHLTVTISGFKTTKDGWEFSVSEVTAKAPMLHGFSAATHREPKPSSEQKQEYKVTIKQDNNGNLALAGLPENAALRLIFNKDLIIKPTAGQSAFSVLADTLSRGVIPNATFIQRSVIENIPTHKGTRPHRKG